MVVQEVLLEGENPWVNTIHYICKNNRKLIRKLLSICWCTDETFTTELCRKRKLLSTIAIRKIEKSRTTIRIYDFKFLEINICN